MENGDIYGFKPLKHSDKYYQHLLLRFIICSYICTYLESIYFKFHYDTSNRYCKKESK